MGKGGPDGPPLLGAFPQSRDGYWLGVGDGIGAGGFGQIG